MVVGGYLLHLDVRVLNLSASCDSFLLSSTRKANVPFCLTFERLTNDSTSRPFASLNCLPLPKSSPACNDTVFSLHLQISYVYNMYYTSLNVNKYIAVKLVVSVMEITIVFCAHFSDKTFSNIKCNRQSQIIKH